MASLRTDDPMELFANEEDSPPPRVVPPAAFLASVAALLANARKMVYS